MSFLKPLGGAKENDEKVTGGRAIPAQKVKVIREYVVVEVFPWGHACLQAPSELQLARWRQAAACTDVSPPLQEGSSARAAQGVAPRRGEEKQLTLGNQADSLSGSEGSENLKISCSEPPASGAKQSFQSVFPLPADAIVHQSVNVETGSGSLPAQTERGSARTLGCVDGKEPKLEDFELAILEHQAILHYDGGDGRLRVDWRAEEPAIHLPADQPQGGVSVPVPAPGFPVPCRESETHGQVQGGLSTGQRVGSAKRGLCKPAPLAVETTETRVPSLFGVPESFQSVVPLPADAIVHQSDNVATGSGSLPAQTERWIDHRVKEEDGDDKQLGVSCMKTLPDELEALEADDVGNDGGVELARQPAALDIDDGGAVRPRDLEAHAVKAGLVSVIKALQRAGQSTRMAWGAYCDEHADGVKDPDRHDVESLVCFMNSRSELWQIASELLP